MKRILIALAVLLTVQIADAQVKSPADAKKAVETGYWNLFRYNPDSDDKFSLDSKPSKEYSEFLAGETRFTSMYKKDKVLADKLFKDSEENAKNRLTRLEKLDD